MRRYSALQTSLVVSLAHKTRMEKMKAIMISIKPKWCAKIMNGEKTIEVRKNKALANAIQKLIDENEYADIYVYCTKDKSLIYTDGTDGKGEFELLWN